MTTPRLSTGLASTLLAALIVTASPANAQTADSTVTMASIMVTAERAASSLASSTAAISVLPPRRLRDLPTRNAGNLLGQLPGITFLDFDGLGYAPQAVTRGFYGGGEAEYVVVLLNGRPLNNLENGLVNWEQILLAPDARVEVLRGGASSLYGDAAIGAVLSIQTDAPLQRTRTLSLQGGTLGLLKASAQVADTRYRMGGQFTAHDGYRDHSARQSGSLSGSYQLTDALTFEGGASTREFDTPGPLRSSDAALGEEASLAFFRFDRTEEDIIRLGLTGDWYVAGGRLSGSVSGSLRNQDQVRTVPLSSDFADTQAREVEATALRGTVQLSEVNLPLGIGNRLIVGAEASAGSLDSRYLGVVTGGLDEYSAASGDRTGELDSGTASRTGASAYSHLELTPTSRLKLSLGGRFDLIRDDFDGEGAEAATHRAFSPKVGVNARYVSSPTHVGHAYASASRSFKAPTLDQLYDLRALPVPFPPFAVRIASDQLIPQEGVSLEAGLYHTALLADDITARLSASAYTMDMTNEIDFSFETFSNVSIGKSRHRGVETALALDHAGGTSGFLNYTHQDVTLQAGDNKGNYVKAVPRHTISGGLSTRFESATLGLTFRHLDGMWVDDSNTVSLDGYSTIDFRAGWERGDYRVILDVYNLLDTSYNSTAYPDPAGSDVLFIFPAAGRTFALGVTLSL